VRDAVSIGNAIRMTPTRGVAVLNFAFGHESVGGATMGKRHDNHKKDRYSGARSQRSIDSAVADRVMNVLLDDPRTREAAIDVSSLGGAVTLSGMVPSEEVRKTAESITRQQKGVLTVINDLRVAWPDKHPATPFDDVARLPTSR
jgi:hypothetical protein